MLAYRADDHRRRQCRDVYLKSSRCLHCNAGDTRTRNWYQKLVREKNVTRLTDTRASLWYQTNGTSLPVSRTSTVSGACVAGLAFRESVVVNSRGNAEGQYTIHSRRVVCKWHYSGCTANTVDCITPGGRKSSQQRKGLEVASDLDLC